MSARDEDLQLRQAAVLLAKYRSTDIAEAAAAAKKIKQLNLSEAILAQAGVQLAQGPLPPAAAPVAKSPPPVPPKRLRSVNEPDDARISQEATDTTSAAGATPPVPPPRPSRPAVKRTPDEEAAAAAQRARPLPPLPTPAADPAVAAAAATAPVPPPRPSRPAVKRTPDEEAAAAAQRARPLPPLPTPAADPAADSPKWVAARPAKRTDALAAQAAADPAAAAATTPPVPPPRPSRPAVKRSNEEETAARAQRARPLPPLPTPAADPVADSPKWVAARPSEQPRQESADHRKSVLKRIDEFVAEGQGASQSLEQTSMGLVALKNAAGSISSLNRSIGGVVKELDSEAKAIQSARANVAGLVNDLRGLKKELAGLESGEGDELIKKADGLFSQIDAAKTDSARWIGSAVAAQAAETLTNVLGSAKEAGSIKIGNRSAAMKICEESLAALDKTKNIEELVGTCKNSITDIADFLKQAAVTANEPGIKKMGRGDDRKSVLKWIDEFVAEGQGASQSLEQTSMGLVALKNAAGSISSLNRSIGGVVKELDSEAKAIQSARANVAGLVNDLRGLKKELAGLESGEGDELIKKADGLFSQIDAAKTDSARWIGSAVAAQAAETLTNVLGSAKEAGSIKIGNRSAAMKICEESLAALDKTKNIEELVGTCKNSITDIADFLKQEASPRTT